MGISTRRLPLGGQLRHWAEEAAPDSLSPLTGTVTRVGLLRCNGPVNDRAALVRSHQLSILSRSFAPCRLSAFRNRRVKGCQPFRMLQRDLGNELAGTQVTASFQFEEEAFGADDRTLCQSIEKSALGQLRSPDRIGHRKELSALGRSSAPARVEETSSVALRHFRPSARPDLAARVCRRAAHGRARVVRPHGGPERQSRLRAEHVIMNREHRVAARRGPLAAPARTFASAISLTEVYTPPSSSFCQRQARAGALTRVPSGWGLLAGGSSLPSGAAIRFRPPYR
jgi:hypothetical protein